MKILTSPAVLSVVLARFIVMWLHTVMQMLMPSYFRDVLNLSVSEVGNKNGVSLQERILLFGTPLGHR